MAEDKTKSQINDSSKDIDSIRYKYKSKGFKAETELERLTN